MTLQNGDCVKLMDRGLPAVGRVVRVDGGRALVAVLDPAGEVQNVWVSAAELEPVYPPKVGRP